MARCCGCLDPAGPTCRTQITSADLATLLYVQGLDVNLCEKFAPIASLFQFRDCLGNIIAANSQIVTCADFATRLCETLATLAIGGSAILDVTEVVGADCKTYTIPETPITVIDTSSVDLTASGAYSHTITAVVKISADAGNILVLHPDGLYVPVPVTTCAQLATYAAGAPVVFGTTPLIGQDCLTHVVNETPFTATDSSSIDFTNSGPFGHDLTGVVKISATIGNTVVIAPDGLYVPPATDTTSVLAADTPCFDMTVIQAPAGTFTVSGAPVVSPNAGNQLVCAGNGLFVPASGTITLQPIDTPCFDLTIIETTPGNFQLSGSPVVSPNADNSISCLPNGLFSPDTSIVSLDTACLNIDVVEGPGNNDFLITGNPIISPVVGNQIQCTPQGLFANGAAVEYTVTATDSNCLNLDVVESPAGTFTVSGNPIISPTPGNQISCTGNGLYVAATGAFALTGVDTPCIDITVTPTGASTANISAVPIIAPTRTGYGAGCNPLVCQADGLSVPPEAFAGYASTSLAIPPVFDGDSLEGVTYTGDIHTATFTNTSCRPAYAELTLTVPAINIDGSQCGPGADCTYVLDQQVLHSIVISSPAFTTGGLIGATGQQVVDNNISGVTETGTDTPRGEITFRFPVNAGGTVTYSGRAIYNVLASHSGTGTIVPRVATFGDTRAAIELWTV